MNENVYLINAVKEVKALLNSNDIRNTISMDEAVRMLFNLDLPKGCMYHLDNYITEEEINYRLEGMSDLTRIHNYISSITWLLHEYYYIDGYGNLENISLHKINNTIDDIITDLNI